MRKTILNLVSFSTILSLLLSACNMPSTKPTAPPLPATERPATATAELPTPTPTEMATATSTQIPHTMIPGDVPGGTRVYDSESYSTASLKYAGNGDWYDHNRFERPFTSKEMVYLPYIDIQSFNISKDAKWFFVAVEFTDLATSDKGFEPVYGVEIDYNNDGRGDFLFWVTPPFGKEWSTNNLKVFQDTNHDVGGIRPEQADGKTGDGYDKLVFDAGQGDDPDLAWVRVDPTNVNYIQFAFKQSLIPGNPANGFEAAIWADASNLKDPSKFAYNDLMTIETAGSPLKGDINYPIKELYAVDSTCFRTFGASTGYSPLLCPASEEKVKRPPRPREAPPESGPCIPNFTFAGAPNCP